MEKISDLFKELKERISSPFFFSFIVAWLVWNWQIPISLIFYNIKDLKNDNYTSYIDLINHRVGKDEMFIIPLKYAIAYTILYPFLRNAIEGLNAWFRRWGTSLNLWIAKGGKIPTSKYLALRESYKSRTLTLDKVLEEEKAFNIGKAKMEDDILALEADKLSLNAANAELLTAAQKLDKMFNISCLNGAWNYKKVHTQGHIIIEIDLFFQDGLAYKYDKSSHDKGRFVYRIENFFYNPKRPAFAITFSNINIQPQVEPPTHEHLVFSSTANNSLLSGEDDEHNKVFLSSIS